MNRTSGDKKAPAAVSASRRVKAPASTAAGKVRTKVPMKSAVSSDEDEANLNDGDPPRAEGGLHDAAASPGSDCDPFRLLLKENETLAAEIRYKKGLVAELKRKLAETEEAAERARAEVCREARGKKEQTSAALEHARKRIRALKGQLRARTKENLALEAKVDFFDSRVKSLKEKEEASEATAAANSQGRQQRDLLRLRVERAEAEVEALREARRLEGQAAVQRDLSARLDKVEAAIKSFRLEEEEADGASVAWNSRAAAGAKIDNLVRHQSPPSQQDQRRAPLAAGSAVPVHPSVCVSKNLWIRD